MFRVHPKTVSRWVSSGKLSAVRTLGGHRRYRASEVYALLDESGIGAPEPVGAGVARTAAAVGVGLVAVRDAVVARVGDDAGSSFARTFPPCAREFGIGARRVVHEFICVRDATLT